MINLLVTIFLGWLGVHKFIERKTGLGVVYLLTGGLFGIGWLIDVIIAFIKYTESTKSNTLPSNYPIKIDVVGESYKKDEIASVLSLNKLYLVTDSVFIEKVPSMESIYKYKYREADAVLLPEPTNPHDKNAIKVLVDNVHVGYIPKMQCLELKGKLNKIKSVRANIHSGDYRYHTNNYVYNSESDFKIELYITL